MSDRQTGGERARLRGLHVLADDGTDWRWDPVEQARAACAGGAAVVQLRAKHATDREALAWGSEIRKLTRESGALFVVNDRFDLALLLAADGVHLGQTDLPPTRLPLEARRRLLVGRSTHTLDQARTALEEAVDYVAFGPVFPSRGKAEAGPARGLERLAEVAVAVAPVPLVAIGGIDSQGATGARAAGATGAAVISAVAGADDPLAATRALVTALSEARPA